MRSSSSVPPLVRLVTYSALLLLLLMPTLVSCTSNGDSYTEEDIETLVDSFLFKSNLSARHRTAADRDAENEELARWLSFEATDEERLRHFFELNLETKMLEAYDTLPPEVGQGGELERAYEKALSDCAAEAGWPDVQLQNKSLAYAQQLEAERGFTIDAQLDLAHECARVAEAYPTLDPNRREHLLKVRRDHYLKVVRENIGSVIGD